MTGSGIASARQIAAAVRAGALDPGAVVESTRARIGARNAELNAVVGDWPRDLAAQVEQLRDRLARGEPLPLAGVPVLVKDVIWVRGQRVTQGSLLFRDFVAPHDALAVERLRAAGALIVGMANSSEFACKGLTTNRVYGCTRHPQDPALTPGGSSGGCASAVAAGFVPLALGTDGGGSSRRPPAHVGVVGFKPSFGAIADPPQRGFDHAFPGLQVLAPIGRSVDDVALMFEAMAGPDAGDPQALPALAADPPSATAALRLAWSPRLGLDVPVDDDVAACLERAISALRRAGLPIASADPAWPAGATEDSLMPLQHCGLARLYGDAWQRDPTPFDPDIGRQIARGLQFSGADHARARAAGAAIGAALHGFLGQHDLLLCPTAPCVAWSADLAGPERIGGRAVEPRAHAVFTPFVNHALAAAITLPCGRGRDGLPVGLQLVAARGRDRQLLAAARTFESVLAAQGD